MNKGELIDKVASETKESKATVSKVLGSIIDTIVKTAKKESVLLVGFGTFKLVKSKARMGVNPQTGAKIKIPAKKKIKFSGGKNLTL